MTHWQELIIDIHADQLDEIEQCLTAVGSLAITLADAGDEPLMEPLPGQTPMWAQLRIKALFDAQTHRKTIEQAVLTSLPDLFLQWRQFKDQQWERTCLQHLKPRVFGQRLWVVPTHCVPPDPSAPHIFLDPGLAFGTGNHATTQLCLEWLAQVPIKSKQLLDYGHGSGILSIAAACLGASEVTGIDIDPQAVMAAESNAQLNTIQNNIATQIRFGLEDVSETFDVVIANILAKPLINMASKLSHYLDIGGSIALSGILDTQKKDIMDAYGQWIEWNHCTSLDGWILLAGTRID